jgi:N-acetylglucosaminyldiphosphoundecaprenol N-acetyl-beta-D-mannosaminyltransferase
MGTRGPDVFERAFQPDLPLGERHYLLGSTPENLERLERNLSSLSKESATIGVYSPPFKELSAGEIQEIGLAVRGFRPDIVWVGLGTPKQDYFAQALSQHISVPIVCVGAAFDFLSGSKKTAPRWMQTYGLEWLFRLLTEPKRLWKRYLIGNIKFIFMAIRDKSSK